MTEPRSDKPSKIPLLYPHEVEQLCSASYDDAEKERERAILQVAKGANWWTAERGDASPPVIIEQYGTWAVVDFGLMRLDQPYDLTISELNSPHANWIARFLDDRTVVGFDFLRAFIHARAIFQPHEP